MQLTVGREVLEAFQQSSQLQVRRITDADERFLQSAGDAVLHQGLQGERCRRDDRVKRIYTVMIEGIIGGLRFFARVLMINSNGSSILLLL